MKLFTDMKPEKKLSIKKFANHRIQKSCSCGVLELKGNVKMQHHRVLKEIDCTRTIDETFWTITLL